MRVATDDGERLLLFDYGSLMRGERDHALMAEATALGLAQTVPGYRLVDLEVYAAMIRGGPGSVDGELYEISRELRRRLDVHKEVPVLFERQTVRLADGREADAYVMPEARVVGRRRLRHGKWRLRFSPAPRAGAPPRRR